mmetsp:Transcript_90968/g.278468  ORF Transcript_90968/g.278468 Transcript_90968/m.278468 type:complete len:213 (-) Transcript_90968:551-1189(-)
MTRLAKCSTPSLRTLPSFVVSTIVANVSPRSWSNAKANCWLSSLSRPASSPIVTTPAPAGSLASKPFTQRSLKAAVEISPTSACGSWRITCAKLPSASASSKSRHSLDRTPSSRFSARCASCLPSVVVDRKFITVWNCTNSKNSSFTMTPFWSVSNSAVKRLHFSSSISRGCASLKLWTTGISSMGSREPLLSTSSASKRLQQFSMNSAQVR